MYTQIDQETTMTLSIDGKEIPVTWEDSGGRGFVTGYKRCRQCGYETTEDFDFCPKCGTRF